MPVHTRNTSPIELTGPDVALARPLFEAAPANAHGFLFSVLEGNHAGRIFVDNAGAPTAAMATLACEFNFLVGDARNTAFAAAVQQLLLTDLAPPPAPWGRMLFLMPLTQAWHTDVLQRYSGYRIDDISRRVFTFDPARFTAQHRDWQNRIPDTFTLRRYDRELVQSAEGLVEFWSGIDNFLANGFGFALMEGGEVASRCHTVLCGAGEAEISVETAEPYRRQGLATLTACAFIEHALQRGMRPAWSCWFNNHASITLAGRLGFLPAADMPVCVVVLDDTAHAPATGDDAEA
jgi:RimJ/RimL family protein N-acetyltransferase